MANLLYRTSTNPTTPASTTAKGTPLTNLEVDGNFKALNDDVILKAPLASPTFTGSVTIPGGTINNTSIGATTPSTGKFTTLDATSDVTFSGTSALKIPSGTEAQKPASPVNGMIRYNSTLSKFEGYKGGLWGTLGGGGATGGQDDDVFYENRKNVRYDYTVTANKNAMTAGPIEIDAGVTVTIPDSSTWVVI